MAKRFIISLSLGSVAASALVLLLQHVPPQRTRPPAQPPSTTRRTLITGLEAGGSLASNGVIALALPPTRVQLATNLSLTGLALEASATPGSGLQGSGVIACEAIHADPFKLGPQRITLSVSNEVLQLTGRLGLAPLLQAVATAGGSITNFNRPTGRIRIESTVLPQALPDSLTGGSETFNGHQIDGRCVLETTFTGAWETPTLAVRIPTLNLDLPELGLAIRGIHAEATWELPQFPRSLPHARCDIQSLTFKTLSLEDVSARFQTRKNMALFLEHLEAKWCRGVLRLFSLEVSPTRMPERMIIYANSLNLGDFLRQCGLTQATATGHLDGRLPVYYENGKYRIADALLGTRPGATGNVRIDDAAMLDQSLGATQRGELLLARAALRNFNYDWVRVDLFTRKGVLHLNVGLFGKPAKPLQFSVSDDGAIKPTRGRRGATLHTEMQLNLNFTFALPSILQ